MGCGGAPELFSSDIKDGCGGLRLAVSLPRVSGFRVDHANGTRRKNK
jgi:hypothetical protein